MLAAFMSPVKFSNIFFPVWNFVRSLKFYYKTIFGQSLPLKSLEIRLFCCKLRSRKRRNSSSVFHRNPKYILGFSRHFMARKHRNPGIPHRYSATATNNQANSHNFKTINWIYLQQLSLPNLRWFFADGRVKQAKDWRFQLTFRRAKKISVMDIQPYVSLHSRGSVCYVIQADKCSVLDFGPFVWQLRFVDKTWQTRRNVVRKSLKVRPTATLLTKSSTLSVKWRLAKHFSKTHRR